MDNNPYGALSFKFREEDVLCYGGNSGDTLSAQHEITTNLLIEKQDLLLTKDRERLMEDRRHFSNI